MDFEEKTKPSLQLNDAVEIDSICEAYDRNWQPEKTPTIHKLIGQMPANLRNELLHELLLTDFENRARTNSRRACAFYEEQFSEYTEQVARASEAAFEKGYGPLDLKIGRYQIQEEIGKGGMGRIYRAFDSELRRDVAIKTLHPLTSTNPDRIQRFRNEITSVANLSHPNIVTMHDVVYRGETTFAVMELLGGEDLSRRLARGKMQWQDALAITNQVASGLSTAHEKGIVHRDIKPANLFLTKEGETKILDFGVARLRNTAQDALGTQCDTDIGVVIGTADYMSPEQVRGQDVDSRSDIYSMGSVLYEMVTGRKAFGKELVADTQTAILTQSPSFMATDGLPKPVEQLIQKCLNKNVEHRFQSFDELRKATAAILDGTARPGSNSLVIRTGVLAILTLTAMLIFAASFWKSFLTPADSNIQVESLAVMPFLGETEAGYAKENLTFSLTNSLSQFDGLTVRPFSLVYRTYQERTTAQLSELATDLKVDALVTGIVNSTSGDEISIHIELIYPSQNQLIWGGKYQAKSSELLQIQNTIAAEIGKQLGHIVNTKRVTETVSMTDNLQAFEQFVHGKVALSERRPQSVRRAIESFEQAVELDPNFEAAYVGLANCFIVQSERNVIEPNQGFQAAKQYAQRALNINPESIDAQISLAMIEFEFDWSFQAAEQRFRRALKPDDVAPPGGPQPIDHPTGHQWFAEFLSATGRYEEALSEIRIAQNQQPTSAIIESIEGLIHLKAGEFDLATKKLVEVLDKYPNFDRARGYLIDVFEVSDQIERALIQWTALAKSNQGPIDELKSGFKNGGSTGYWEKRHRQDRQLNEIRSVSPLFRAYPLAKVGAPDEAIQLIKKLKDEKNGALAPNLLVHPFFDSLRGQAGFQAILNEIGFAEN